MQKARGRTRTVEWEFRSSFHSMDTIAYKTCLLTTHTLQSSGTQHKVHSNCIHYFLQALQYMTFCHIHFASGFLHRLCRAETHSVTDSDENVVATHMLGELGCMELFNDDGARIC